MHPANVRIYRQALLESGARLELRAGEHQDLLRAAPNDPVILHGLFREDGRDVLRVPGTDLERVIALRARLEQERPRPWIDRATGPPSAPATPRSS